MSEPFRSVPKVKRPVREPAAWIHEAVECIRAQRKAPGPKKPILIVGGIGAGKTTTGFDLVRELRKAQIPIGGVLAPRTMDNTRTVGYSVVDLGTDEPHDFASFIPSRIKIGRFFIAEEGLGFAQRAIITAANRGSVVFVDEVGRLELAGKGHAPPVRHLLGTESVPVLLVRDAFVNEVLKTFGIEERKIFRISDDKAPSPADQRATLWEIVDSIPYPLMVTQSDDGFPQSRPMHLVERNGPALWFATSKTSRKVGQILARPEVTLLFVDSESFNYASFHGIGELSEDPHRKRALWREEWRDDWPAGPADSDYVLLKITGVRGHYLRGYTGQRGEVDLTTP